MTVSDGALSSEKLAVRKDLSHSRESQKETAQADHIIQSRFYETQ